MSDTIEPEKSTGWRASRELWLLAAKDALLKHGPQAIKVQPLATQLNIARSSFYWFFKNQTALTEALLDLWAADNSLPFFAAAEKDCNSRAEAVLQVISAFLDPKQFDPAFDFAVRSWSQQSPAVFARVQEVDRQRLDAIGKLLASQGYDANEAAIRARTMYVAQIGYISMQFAESFELRMARIPVYVRIFSGEDATQEEMDQFWQRHGYRP